HKRLAHLNFKTINQLAQQSLVMGLPSLVYTKDKPCLSCEKEKHHRASFKTKQTFSIMNCLHPLHMDLFGLVTPRSINHEKYTLVIVDEYSRNSILVSFCDEKGISQNFSSPYTPKQNVYIHKHKDYLGKFDEKADDGYFLGYSLISKAFRVFNTRNPQIEETYHITFDESTDAIKISKPSVDNINIAESKRYPPDEYIHHYEPSQNTKALSDQNDQSDQNDHRAQENDIPNDNPPEHFNHNNDSPIIENLINAEVVQDSKLTSSPVEDALAQNII
ncbi:retrovirus-related pol polyprotein from transposon TNT 1-94, partial [Tanacetum coccineum]